MDAIEQARVTRLARYAQQIVMLKKALQNIANLNEADCERYVAKADLIAVDALVELENWDDFHAAV